MRFVIAGILLVACPALTQAGYDEFRLVDLSTCTSFTLTSDAPQPDPEASDTDEVYKAYLRANNVDWHRLMGLYDNVGGSTQWADCRWREITADASELTCTVIGATDYRNFSCPLLGYGAPWYRSCKVAGMPAARLRIYSVDTAEYETGGTPFGNQFLLRAEKNLQRLCKRR